MQRREALKKMAIGSGIVSLGSGLLTTMSYATAKNKIASISNNKIKQSVCRWCYNDFSLDEMCQQVSKLGLSAIDLCGPKDWKTLQSYNLYSSMCNGAEINLVHGFNNTQYHSTLTNNYSEMIPLVQKNGYRNLICFSGNRDGMDDLVGLKNMKAGIEKILPLAEKHKVVLCLELFNSKVNHPDYMADSVAWGVELCKQLSSLNFKLLYDIYHMQIQEGNLIETIKDNKDYIAHYHTAGVPGRHEINTEQEIYYPAVMEAINETGFDGFLAHEFLHTYSNPWDSLKEAIQITKKLSL